MTDVMSQIMGSSQAVVPTNEELKAISVLAERQLLLERKIESIELDLQAEKDKLRQVTEFLLPEAMAAVGLSEFKLENGMKLTVKEDIQAGIRKDFTNQAIDWLDENGLGGIVKDDVSVKFGRGEAIKAKQLVDWCERSGFNVEEKLSVHPMTLKATVKEQMANGVVFPDEFFTIYPHKKTVIKLK